MPNRNHLFSKTPDRDSSAQRALSLNKRGVSLASKNQLAEAIQLFKQALVVHPSLVATHHNLGAVYMMNGNFGEAAACYRRVIEADPRSSKAHFNLANIYRSQGQSEKAISHLKRVIELDPDHHSAGHILAACRGETPARAPAKFVTQLFDQYSATFERVLLKNLDYNTPSKLWSIFKEALGDTAKFDEVLDLGCGTGLAGKAFQPVCSRLTGIDLSAKMLEQGKEKGVYNTLLTGDIFDYLSTTSSRFDLFISADVFNYLGDLEPIFRGIRRCSKKVSYLVFSTESFDGKGFRLTKSGRFAHSAKYVQTVARKFDFSIVSQQSSEIRKEQSEAVQGDLFLMK